MKRNKLYIAVLTLAISCALPQLAQAGSLTFVNKSAHKAKVASIGGSGYVEPNGGTAEIHFNNEEDGADINIWWVKNARQLCQIFTPWDRTVQIHGKREITCLSRN